MFNQKLQEEQSENDYGHLVVDGHYSPMPTGLWGKYDNIRRCWENQITRFAIQPVMQSLLKTIRKERRGLRILDMGCGTGEGWDLLTQIPRLTGVRSSSPQMLRKDDLEIFHGIDLSPAMVELARQRFANNPKMKFDVCDLGQPDEILATNPAYDLYFSSYGSPSHLNDGQLWNLLTGIAQHTNRSSVVVLDLLGQYSLEWPCYWGYSENSSVSTMAPYNMVWLYPPEEQASHRSEFDSYKVRYWGGEELKGFIHSIPELESRNARIQLIDRSILCGRHLDTSEFYPGAKPIRRALNGLFEFNYRTKSSDLITPKIPNSRNYEISAFFKNFCALWNAAIEAYRITVIGDDPREQLRLIFDRFQLPVQLENGFKSVFTQHEGMGWLEPGDPLSNAIQPQFGLLLRQLEFHMQRGLGCGHGLIAIIELSDRR